ncbi:polyhydroxyalkanoic acid system family protein [Ottowia sp.]|uniref:polyhydroxyalkanoic acid system family protein n=1 Tax=Ottowia sp. TaxID=1898956 RepID=UPI002CBB758D|nr:polyhydroxyalkanoic acid system family protein [Ottowia sp.]HOB67298.1 polyhydroxyalkanoic acid system family protein [Ottowia sp.]HPZ55925.1 polyhydroxyalkanoic acid system family protein [Ottowia sp.]HQD47774.1 polyhydroxyalkanoic acid system family protein [Ottowia sp.]
MSEITITRTHTLPPRKARQAAEAVASGLRADFGLDYAWDDGNTLSFRRPGLSGQLTLQRKQVTVQIRLGLIFSPLKASFEREIHDYFDQRFAPRAA